MMDTKRIKEVSKMSKAELRAIIFKDAKKRGRTWLIGGPDKMSKDELISYVLREVENNDR